MRPLPSSRMSPMRASVQHLVDTVVKKYGKLDILVNAMGMNIKRDAMEYPMEDWDKLFEVNVKGTMIACKFAARAMKEQNGGAIVNLSSVRGIRGYHRRQHRVLCHQGRAWS